MSLPSLTSAMLLTSLAFLRPHCGPWDRSPGRSTATNDALTLLTCLELLDATEPEGDRPREGGEFD